MTNRVSIKGIPWSFEKINAKKYKSLYGSGSMACTLKLEHKMVFIVGKCDLHTIIHEVTHAFISSCCLDSASLDEEAIEEVFCEINSWHLEDIRRISRVIHKRLNK